MAVFLTPANATATESQLIESWAAGAGAGDSSPISITPVGDSILFHAIDRSHGRELWRTDGTEQGTALVRDIYPGSTSSTSTAADPGPPQLAELDGTIYFVAGDPAHGSELWRSDGTEAGTQLVKDIRPGPNGSLVPDSPDYSAVKVVGDTLYFTASDGTRGRELWRSDGTTAGTALVKDINPGPAQSNPHILATEDGALYFLADDGIHGSELWRSDGTSNGTELIKDINPGPLGSSSGVGNVGPDLLAKLDSTLYFSADDGVHGDELWRSDGTTAGTELVRDLNPGAAPAGLTALTALKGDVYFRASDGIHGSELWRSDGTSGGTELVKDINPGPNGSGPSHLIAIEGTLRFIANDGNHGAEPWTSDGTGAGTTIVRDIFSGPASAVPQSAKSSWRYAALGDHYYFLADDGVHGTELWSSDGSEAGTALVRDIKPGSIAEATGLTPIGDTLYFTVTDGVHGRELWKTDGSPSGTILVRDINLSYGWMPSNLADVGGNLFFSARTEVSGHELWTSDGTPEGTFEVKDVNPTGSSSPASIVDMNGTAMFTANDGTHGTELWKSDRTNDGTTLVKDINPSPGASAAPSNLTPIGDTVYFTANDGTHGTELWKSDGTGNGTTLVKDIDSVGDRSAFPRSLTVLDDALYFSAADGTHGAELWKSDGTESGTTLVKDINPGPGSSTLWSLTEVDDLLYFTSFNKLWTSDGTPAGTMAVGSFGPSPPDEWSTSHLWITPLGSSVLLSGLVVGDLGCCSYWTDLWASDGTPAGTTLLDSIDYGSELHMIEAGSRVYFRAEDEASGSELWMTDGTAEGTGRLDDIASAADGSYPSGFAVSGDRVFFATVDDTAGKVELRSLDVSDTSAEPPPSPGGGSSEAPLSPQPPTHAASRAVGSDDPPLLAPLATGMPSASEGLLRLARHGKLTRRTALVEATCIGIRKCTGTLRLLVRRRGCERRCASTIAAGRFVVRSGRVRTIRLRPTAIGASLARRRDRGLAVTAAVSGQRIDLARTRLVLGRPHVSPARSRPAPGGRCAGPARAGGCRAGA